MQSIQTPMFAHEFAPLDPHGKDGNKRLPCSTGCWECKYVKDMQGSDSILRESSFCPASIILTRNAHD